VNEELKQHFRPEFLNRVDETIVFHQLSPEDIQNIVDLMVSEIDARLADRDMGIELTPAARTLIAKRGYDPVLGARPLRRAIQREIEDPVAEQILFGELTAGSIVVVDAVPGADEKSLKAFTFVGTPKTTLPDVPFAELDSGSPQG